MSKVDEKVTGEEPAEETQRLNPAMVAAKAKAVDARVKETDPNLKETPKAPAVATKAGDADAKATGDEAKSDDAKADDANAKKADARKADAKGDADAKKADAKSDAGDAPLAARASAWAKRNVDPLIGAGIALIYVAWLLGTARSLGFSRDEGFYFSASGEYERWFKVLFSTPGKAFERPVIDQIWAANHEHPSLMKSLFALSHHFFWQKWKIFDDPSTAFRFPGMLSMGLALGVTYVFGARAFSRRAGIIAAVALGLMPNVFYHAHLACFDVPIMAMWITCIFTYWCAEKKGGLGWALAAGVMYGLTLETKHNAWMLPAVFLPHAILVHGRAMASETSKTARLPVPATLIAMATIGPAVFLALWPWLWNDTLPRIQEYVNFHLHHDYYNIEFLGVTYFGPPSPKSYMPVMIAATVPTVTLVLFAIGAFDRARVLVARFASWFSQTFERTLPWPKTAPSSDPMHTDALLFLSLAVPLAVFLLPRTPIFGGTKHWITAYPALALFAGRGFDLVATRIEAALRDKTTLDATKRSWVLAFVGAITFLAPFAVTRHSHPFGLSAYVPLFGGTAGGADLGLNRQFWGFTTQSLDPWFRENTKPGDTVYIMDTAWQSWQRMIDEKRIPPWLRGVGSPAEAEISIVHHEQHINEVDYNIWTEYGTAAPEYVLTHDGVPIVSVYRRPHGLQRGRGRNR
ncbi:MAG: glycosyltransferase family 39 protein [Labilithrix sp.]|nr:glycosyltransferase family 39 protein [Labilithrix sp.]